VEEKTFLGWKYIYHWKGLEIALLVGWLDFGCSRTFASKAVLSGNFSQKKAKI